MHAGGERVCLCVRARVWRGHKGVNMKQMRFECHAHVILSKVSGISQSPDEGVLFGSSWGKTTTMLHNESAVQHQATTMNLTSLISGAAIPPPLKSAPELLTPEPPFHSTLPPLHVAFVPRRLH